MKATNFNPSHERGAVLVISLVLLMIMTILAVTLSQTSTLEQRMAGNARDLDAAFQASEAGLRGAEVALQAAVTDIRANPSGCTDSSVCFTNDKGTYSQSIIASSDNNWWRTNGVEYGTSSTQDLTHVHDDPRSVIVEKQSVTDSLNVDSPARVYYEVTAHANGTTTGADVITQSIYGKWSIH